MNVAMIAEPVTLVVPPLEKGTLFRHSVAASRLLGR
jgi:hypothetical protein